MFCICNFGLLFLGFLCFCHWLALVELLWFPCFNFGDFGLLIAVGSITVVFWWCDFDYLLGIVVGDSGFAYDVIKFYV